MVFISLNNNNQGWWISRKLAIDLTSSFESLNFLKLYNPVNVLIAYLYKLLRAFYLPIYKKRFANVIPVIHDSEYLFFFFNNSVYLFYLSNLSTKFPFVN